MAGKKRTPVEEFLWLHDKRASSRQFDRDWSTTRLIEFILDDQKRGTLVDAIRALDPAAGIVYMTKQQVAPSVSAWLADIDWSTLQEGADDRLRNIGELVERFNQTPTAQHIWLRIVEDGFNTSLET